jgi:hypothetical protein
MLKAVESTELTPYEKLMLEVAEKHFEALAHLNSPGKRHAKNGAGAVSDGVRSDLYSPGQEGHESKSAMWSKYGAINEDDIRALRVLDLDRIRSDEVQVCSAKGRGKGAILGTVGEVAWLVGGGPVAWTSTGLTTGFDMMKSHGSAGMAGADRGGAIGAQYGQKLASKSCQKNFDKKELPQINALMSDLDATDLETLEKKVDAGDPEAMYKYGKTLKALGDYRTLDNIARQENHREDRVTIRADGHQTLMQAADLGSASAKLDNAKILIKSSDDEDRKRAIQYFEAAVKADCRGAKTEYGRVLVEMGSNAADSESVFKGLSLLEAAAKSGDLVALGQLRDVYAKGVSAHGQEGYILPPNPARVTEVDSYMANRQQSAVAAGGD